MKFKTFLIFKIWNEKIWNNFEFAKFKNPGFKSLVFWKLQNFVSTYEVLSKRRLEHRPWFCHFLSQCLQQFLPEILLYTNLKYLLKNMFFKFGIISNKEKWNYGMFTNKSLISKKQSLPSQDTGIFPLVIGCFCTFHCSIHLFFGTFWGSTNQLVCCWIVDVCEFCRLWIYTKKYKLTSV